MRVRILSLVLFLVAASAFAAKSTSVNVTTIVHDTDSSGAPLLLKSDDYNGSGQATYSLASVASYVFSDGRYFLRLYGQSVRTLFITRNNRIDGSQPMVPPPGYYWQDVGCLLRSEPESGPFRQYPDLQRQLRNDCGFRL
jgi:hypothetical protein